MTRKAEARSFLKHLAINGRIVKSATTGVRLTIIEQSVDGTKTIKMTVTLTAEVPASLEIKNDKEGYQTIRGCFPSMIIRQDDGEGGGSQVDDELDHFFMNGCVMDHSIEVVGLINEET